MELIFSPVGAAIAIALAVIVAATAVVVVSFRNQTIDFGAKGYTFKLGPTSNPLPTINQPTQVSAKPDSPTPEDENVPNESVLLNSNHSFSDWLKKLQYEKNKIEPELRSASTQNIKDVFFPQTPYEWEVWKHIELLRAGFVDSVREVERLEREHPALAEASRSLARYYLRIGAPEKASSHIATAITRANSDSARASALLLQAELIENTKGKSEARHFLIGEIESINDSEQKAILFSKLGDTYRDEGNRPLDA